jgi:dTDP-4-amino-4,6-dideoxygalactose transaminase
MRVVLFAEDDSATSLLPSLSGCKVLGVRAGDSPLPLFSKRCAELSFDTVLTDDSKLTGMVVEHFKPDIALVTGRAGRSFFSSGCLSESCAQYWLSMGSNRSEADAEEDRWPEFAPIWDDWRTSRVSLVDFKDSGAEIGAVVTSVAMGETALSLRAKHMEAAAQLIGSLLRGDLSSPQPALIGSLWERSSAPATISLDWDSETVDRFVRASSMPPHKPAEVIDPSNGDVYLIENMMQYHTFQQKVVGDGSAAREDMPKHYAADTHWYSNAGGTVIKIGDKNIHMPWKSEESVAQKVIPGAIVGSTREKLRMNEPLIGPNAERYCSSALASGWIGVEGPFVKKFEAHLASICGCAAACAVQSGTAALYGAMKGLGVSEPSQHVLVPSFTCAAAADAVVHAGGTPIAIDCELDTYGISTDAVRLALESNPSVVGIIVAHCYGVPIRDMHEIQTLCRQHGIWLCEDACETFGASIALGASAVPIGSLGTLSVISVRSEKMIGVGEGGAIVGNDTTLVARAKWWCSRAPCRGVGLWRVYEHEGVGQNFRLPEMLACIGVAAAEMLPTVIDRKRQIHAWYEEHIARPGLENVKLQVASEGDGPVWWINSALLP